MTENNNLPDIEIKRTAEGFVTKVGKVQTGPLPTLREAQQEGRELQKIEIQTAKVPASILFLILLGASLTVSFFFGLFTGWDTTAMISSFAGAFLFGGVFLNFFR